MNRCLHFGFAALIACVVAVPCNGQCGFAIIPAAEQRWYRSEGWPIPGLSDAKGFAAIQRTAADGKPTEWVFPEGVSVQWVVHDRDLTDRNYQVQFPDAFFDDDGTRKHMLSRSFKLYQMVRWQMNGTTYAYSYELGPHDVLCTATVDIIDDRGDGKFRLMVSPGHTLFVVGHENPVPPPVPDWLMKPKS